MSENSHRNRRRRRRGSTIVELAVSIPVLVTLCVGAADYGRMFYHVVTLIDSAGAGAGYGALRAAHTGDFDGMEAIASQAASDVSRLSKVFTKAQRFCDCPDAPASSPDDENAVACNGTVCTGYGTPRVYVQVQVGQEFSTFAKYPGIGKTRTLAPTAIRRVQ